MTLRFYTLPSCHQGRMSEEPLPFSIHLPHAGNPLALGVHAPWVASVYKMLRENGAQRKISPRALFDREKEHVSESRNMCS